MADRNAGAPDAVVRVRSPEEWAVFKARLERPEAAAKQVAALQVAVSQRAFREQRLGDVPWPARSMFVTDSRGRRWLVNVAGIVADMNRGASPPARRFEERPALVDTNALRRSVASQVTAEPGRTTIATGSTLAHASVHQSGGPTSTPITPAGKANLRAWIKRSEGAEARRQGREARDRFKPRTDAQQAELDRKGQRSARNAGVADGLRFLLNKDVWRQRVPPRPFVGITAESLDKIPRILALSVARGDDGGSDGRS